MSNKVIYKENGLFWWKDGAGRTGGPFEQARYAKESIFWTEAIDEMEQLIGAKTPIDKVWTSPVWSDLQ